MLGVNENSACTFHIGWDVLFISDRISKISRSAKTTLQVKTD